MDVLRLMVGNSFLCIKINPYIMILTLRFNIIKSYYILYMTLLCHTNVILMSYLVIGLDILLFLNYLEEEDVI